MLGRDHMTVIRQSRHGWGKVEQTNDISTAIDFCSYRLSVFGTSIRGDKDVSTYPNIDDGQNN